MTTVNPLSTMLATAFKKLDRNEDGKLDRAEFNTFYEILKPGIALDENSQPKISSSDYFKRMDADSDGAVTGAEVQACGVLMPAALSSDGSLDAMLQYLRQQTSEAAALAATLLELAEEPKERA